MAAGGASFLELSTLLGLAFLSMVKLEGKPKRFVNRPTPSVSSCVCGTPWLRRGWLKPPRAFGERVGRGGNTRNSESAQLGTCKTSPEVSLWRFGHGSYFSLAEPAGLFKIGPTESETFCRGVSCNELTPFTGALSFFMQAACLQPQHVKGDVTQSCKYGGIWGLNIVKTGFGIGKGHNCRDFKIRSRKCRSRHLQGWVWKIGMILDSWGYGT